MADKRNPYFNSKYIIDKSGFEMTNRVVLKDKKTGVKLQMNTSYKCNCCCKEDVCNKKCEYTLDCNMIKQSIKSSATEVSIECKYFQAYSATIKSGEQNEDS